MAKESIVYCYFKENIYNEDNVFVTAIERISPDYEYGSFIHGDACSSWHVSLLSRKAVSAIMRNDNMKRLKREELLEMLIEQSEEAESLMAQNAKLKERVTELETEVTRLGGLLNERSVKKDEAGSLAEAALALSGIFAAADEAASIYLDNVRQLETEKKSELEKLRRMAARRAQSRKEEMTGNE